MSDEEQAEEVGPLPNGYTLYRKPNGVGGHVYYSHEIGGGVVLWDTCLGASSSLLAAIVAEESRRYREWAESRKNK